jgi:hypothetical protein
MRKMLVCAIGTHAPFPQLRKSTGIVGAAGGKKYLLVPVVCGRFHLYFIATSLAIFPYLRSGPNLWSSVAKKYYHRRTHADTTCTKFHA